MHRLLLAALAVVPAITTPRAQSVPVRLQNLAPHARTQWVDVAVPAADAAALPDLCRVAPHGWIAVKGAGVGVHSTLFHVLASLPPDSRVDGDLRPASGQPPAFEPSPFVTDDLGALFPRARVVIRGKVHGVVQPRYRLVEVTPARQVWRLRGRLGTSPLVLEAWLYVYSRQDVVRFEATFTNSLIGSSALSVAIDGLWIETGEYLAVDYRTRLGLLRPFRHRNQWVQVVSGPRALGRGEQLFLTGRLLALPSRATTPAGGWTVRAGGLQTSLGLNGRVGTLRAARHSPALGLSLDWDGHWLGFGATPVLPVGARPNGGWSEADRRYAGFAQSLGVRGDWYDDRPLGLNRHAGTTGAQNDFGATQGTMAVTVGDPRYLFRAFYSMSDFLRPFHNREPDAAPLEADQHPLLHTWDQIPHCRTSGDMLGLQCPLPVSWPSSGFGGIDDQHRSQNHFNALLALTGSRALKGCLQDYLEIDLRQVPGWAGAPRAQGRLFMAWSGMLLLLDRMADRRDLLVHMGRRMKAIESSWPGGAFLGDPTRPIRVLAVGSDPSFLGANGQRIPAWIVWEHSIASMGFYAAWKVTGVRRFRDMALRIGELVTRYGCFRDQGRWHTCTAVRYLQGAAEGRALPATSYRLGTNDLRVDNGFWSWNLPAVIVTRLLTGDATLRTRCDAILADVAPRGPESWGTSCWWALR